ncbi:hypothetical protein EVAR_65058_1 [Eumeta japonica]|uniref:Uncharacterized protein n=1 Tax=Eumeta variegata TaxID=151549 RepID=A0A4C1ZYN1_EUMVA|nr:hypothetical protein EVAR_65058_1 [Eumeta japonica]
MVCRVRIRAVHDGRIVDADRYEPSHKEETKDRETISCPRADASLTQVEREMSNAAELEADCASLSLVPRSACTSSL